MRAGIIVDSLGISQLSIILTNELNKLSTLKEYWDIIVFYHRYSRTIKTQHFATMQEKEMWGFNVPMMSTSLYTTKRLLNCQGPTKKLFYVWNLEWIFGNYNTRDLSEIYLHPEISLIARSQQHFDIIKKCWKEPVAILEDFNHEQLTTILS